MDLSCSSEDHKAALVILAFKRDLDAFFLRRKKQVN